ncbi:hypothetical protein F2P56_008596 [Juglans regia]|uniref:Retrotransposon Copia-like N-terminal domain-containing protein n=1 Tax=Juglans regia TaxID=51240 RepID=A0A834D0F2_JUGRE|nr:hypothetical protein F2P56_008596 [Juglans regia]
MAAEKPKSPFLDFNNILYPYRLDHGDNPSLHLVLDLLTAENYTTWSRAMCRAVHAKNKLGFINGTLLKPKATTDPLHDAWECCNDLVVSWLHNSINPTLKSGIALVDNAQQIWDELKDCFTQQNGYRIFQFKKALAGLQQENDPVNVYFGRFPVQIMLLDPLPPINKIFSMIQQQEMQHLMLSGLPSPDSMSKEVPIANHSVSNVQADCNHPSTMNGTNLCLTSFTPTFHSST